jgi:hypothetical protein
MKILILIALFFSFNASAQEMSVKPDPMQIVIMGKGKVSKREYDEFWQYVGATTKEEKASNILAMRRSFLPMQEYQKEIWTCAEIIYKKRKKIACPKAKAVLNAYKKSSNLGDKNPYVQELEKMSDKILNAAFTREKISFIKEQEPIALDAKAIKESKDAFTSGIARLKQVLVLEYK